MQKGSGEAFGGGSVGYNKYWKRNSWKPKNYFCSYNRRPRFFNHRDFCYQEFDYGFNKFEQSKTQQLKEFHVPPIFDHIYPRYEIRLETQYFFGYLALRLKSENPENIESMRKGVLQNLGNDIVYIDRIDQDSKRTKVYENPLFQGLPPDPNASVFTKVLVNGRDVCRYTSNAKSDQKEFYTFLAKYCTDTLGNPIKEIKWFYSNAEDKLKRLKKGGYSDPNLIIEKYSPSGLEKHVAEAFQKNNISVEHQAKIIFHNQVLTIVDFLVRDEKIAIYCDGFKYHSDSQKMTIDRRQDRILQNMGYMVMRFTDSEVENDVIGVINEISETIRLRKSKSYYNEG